jgi:hypothetical protein
MVRKSSLGRTTMREHLESSPIHMTNASHPDGRPQKRSETPRRSDADCHRKRVALDRRCQRASAAHLRLVHCRRIRPRSVHSARCIGARARSAMRLCAIVRRPHSAAEHWLTHWVACRSRTRLMALRKRDWALVHAPPCSPCHPPRPQRPAPEPRRFRSGGCCDAPGPWPRSH